MHVGGFGKNIPESLLDKCQTLYNSHALATEPSMLYNSNLTNHCSVNVNWVAYYDQTRHDFKPYIIPLATGIRKQFQLKVCCYANIICYFPLCFGVLVIGSYEYKIMLCG